MFFDNRDDLSEVLYNLKEEFINSGQKKFAIEKIASYDELTYKIAERYIPKFNRWIKENSANQAEVLTNRVYKSSTTRQRDMYTDGDESETESYYGVDVFIVWTGKLPKP